MIDVSVIICSHNPRKHYIQRVLKALEEQVFDSDRWELLLVDSASGMPLERELDLSWHPTGRHVREDKLGLSRARIRGIQEARGGVLIFVDDDNVLKPNYLSEAVRLGQEWPQLGVWGGSIVGEFEKDPPEPLREYLSLLALREVQWPRWSNVATCADATPWGAGMCVRAGVAMAYVNADREATLRIPDRTGSALISGGDTEIAIVACSLGLGMGVFPELEVLHLIPRERVSEEYLIRVSEGIQTTVLLLGFKWKGECVRQPFTPIGILRLLYQLLTRRGIRRRLCLARVRAQLSARRILAEGRGIR